MIDNMKCAVNLAKTVDIPLKRIAANLKKNMLFNAEFFLAFQIRTLQVLHSLMKVRIKNSVARRWRHVLTIAQQKLRHELLPFEPA